MQTVQVAFVIIRSHSWNVDSRPGHIIAGYQSRLQPGYPRMSEVIAVNYKIYRFYLQIDVNRKRPCCHRRFFPVGTGSCAVI
mgnify:CR=1 FL=1